MSIHISYMLRPALGKKGDSSMFNRELMASHILNTVCAFYGIDKKLVLSKRRFRDLCMCRHVTAHLLKYHTNLSLKEIAKLVGGKDHTTIIHSLRQIKDLMETEDGLVDEIHRIETIIAPPPINKEETVLV